MDKYPWSNTPGLRVGGLYLEWSIYSLSPETGGCVDQSRGSTEDGADPKRLHREAAPEEQETGGTATEAP